MLSIATAADNQVHAELIADVEAIAPGTTARIGVLLTLPDHAHVYWRNPGDSGLASGVEWKVPQGMTVGDLQWPNPKRFEVEGLDDVNHGYEKEVLLFADVTVPDGAADSISIEARAYWLLCLDDGVCIPEEAEFSLVVPVKPNGTSSVHAKTFDTFAARIPRSAESHVVPLTIETSAELGRLKVSTTSPWKFIAIDGQHEANAFPFEGAAWRRVESSSGTSKVAFGDPDAEKAAFVGVLTLPVRNTQTEESKTLFISIPE